MTRNARWALAGGAMNSLGSTTAPPSPSPAQSDLLNIRIPLLKSLRHVRSQTRDGSQEELSTTSKRPPTSHGGLQTSQGSGSITSVTALTSSHLSSSTSHLLVTRRVTKPNYIRSGPGHFALSASSARSRN